MKKFDEQLLRLKQVVKLAEDQDVAVLLGMSKAAFSDRKKRDAFPDDKLAALAVRRPELGIDVSYVLTGGTLTERQRKMQAAARQATLAAGLEPAQERLSLSLLNQADLQMAVNNASRADNYAQITELLAGSSDETVALVLQLVARLYLADLPKAVKGGR